MQTSRINGLMATGLGLTCCTLLHAQDAFVNRYVGDLGGAVYSTSAIVKSKEASTTALPYVYGDWGRYFARVDTVGAKLLPVGMGHLEGVLRMSQEGYQTNTTTLKGIGQRNNPVPIGLGTFQRTSLGGVFVYAMHDLTSGGNALDLTYGARLDLGSIKIYPQAGLEYRSQAYVQHLYGVSSIEAAASQAAGGRLATYTAGAATTPMVGLAMVVPLSGPWSLQLQWRHKWLDNTVKNSPLVGALTQNTGFAGVSYEFK
jgi:outer membrane protein